eukprot:2274453-Rhodomonas_salina.1
MAARAWSTSAAVMRGTLSPLYAAPTASTDVNVVQKFEAREETPTAAEYPVHSTDSRIMNVTTVLSVIQEKSTDKCVALFSQFKPPIT